MKRVLLKTTLPVRNKNVSISDDKELSDISEYISEIRMLSPVPFSYLVADEALLPAESIRFFYLDENWLNAITDGALSIGRISKTDASIDSDYFNSITEEATKRLPNRRHNLMHKNHRKSEKAGIASSKVRTGFLLRSELVGKWKGLEVSGYSGDNQLDILRMEALSNEILICIFDGELTKFVVSEPKTGLRFGGPDNTGIITLRSVKDDNSFGMPLTGVDVNLNEFIEENGRLKVNSLAEEFKNKLNTAVDSPQFAFQLIAVAKMAQFFKSED